VESGSGLPLTNTPPSWFTPLWPKKGKWFNDANRDHFGCTAAL